MDSDNIRPTAASRLPLEVNKAVRDASLNLPVSWAEQGEAERLAALATALAPLRTGNESNHLTAAALLLLLVDGQKLGERIADALETLAAQAREVA